MRAFIAVAVLALSNGTYGAEPDIAQLAWLSGCWKAENAEPGSGEQWTPPMGGAMLGTSRTIRQQEMVEFEFMQIRTQDDGSLAFIAQPSGNPPTTFRLKVLDGTSVTFENPEHDFPQRVIYAKVGQDLSARIEGDMDGVVRGIDFPLVRIDCSEHFSPR